MKHTATNNHDGRTHLTIRLSGIRAFIALCIMAMALPATAAYVPVAVTGYNADIVANGVGPATGSTTADVDGVNYAFVAPDFRASAGGTAPSRYLPATGLVSSAATGGLAYQLADYSDSNALRLPANGTQDTLFFVTPQTAGEVFILVTCGSGGTSGSNVNFYVNFTDGTSMPFNNINIHDWYGGANYAIQGIGRINLNNNGLEGNASDPRLYEVKLTLTSAQLAKTIAGVTVEKVSGSGVIIVMGVSINNATCYSPAGLTTSGIRADGATIKWTAPTLGVPANYEWRAVPGGQPVTAAAADSGIVAAGADSVVLNGLTASTSYSVYVRSICSTAQGDTATWAGPVNFMTTQIPVTVFPWNEDFETGGTGWTLSNGTQGNKWFADTAARSGGARGLYVSNDNGASNRYTLNATSVVHAWRDISFPAGYPIINLSFDWRGYGERIGSSRYDYMRVWVVPATFIPAAGAQIGSGTGRSQIGGEFMDSANFSTARYTIPSSFAGTTARLVFEWRNDNSSGTQPPAAVDNIFIHVSDCASPAGLTARYITSDSADLTWTPQGAAALWQLEYGPAGFTQGTGTRLMANDTMAHLGNLTDNTSYSVYIRSACTATDSSTWTGPYTFRTLLLPCAGTPDAGVLGASAGYICSTENLTLTARGATVASGLDYEWQSSPAGAGTWTAMSAVADTVRTFSGQAASTDYRLILTCISSGQSATTDTVTVNQRGCYCQPSFSAGCYSWNISKVVYGTINNTAGSCSTNDFTAISTTVNAGAPNTMTVTITAWTGWGVYMDFNNDGDFDDAGEWLYGVYSDPSSTTNLSATITVPGWVPSGSYRMRVMAVWGWGPKPGEACMTRSAAGGGNFQDYTVNVINNASCYPPVNVAVSNIQAYTADLAWAAPPATTPLGYEWRIVPGDSSVTVPAADSGGTTQLTASATRLAASTAYSLYVRSGCGSLSSDTSLWNGPVDFTTLPAPCSGTPGTAMITTIILPPGVCSGGTVALDAMDTTTVVTSGIEYQWQYAYAATGPWADVTGGTGAATLNYTTDGLTDTTWFRVKTTCGHSHDSVFSAATMVPVRKYAFPYAEAFDSTGNDQVPDCFVKNSANGSWSVRNDYHAANGTPLTAIRLDFPASYIGSYPSKNAFFTIPALGLKAGNTYAISFKYCRGRANSTANTGNVYDEYLKLYVNTANPGTTVANVTSGVSLFDYVISADSVQDTLIIFTPAVSGAYYFSWYSNTPSPGSYTTGGTVAVDDIEISDCSVPDILAQPQPQVACIGGSATLAVTANGSGLSYQWQKDGVDIPGATTATYQLSGLTGADAGDYSAVISNMCHDTHTDTVTLTVSPPPAAGIATPGPVGLCPGDSVTLEANTTAGQAYQWMKDGSVLAGATADRYTAVAGGSYQVIVTLNGACADTSADLTVTVHPLPAPVIVPEADGLHAGAGFTAYRWFYDDTPITGAADSIYKPIKDGRYSVEVTDVNGCVGKAVYEYRLYIKTDRLADVIRVYPNPANHMVYIAAPIAVHVSVHSMDGKVILRQENAGRIDIGHLPDGVYTLHITDTENVLLKVEKLMKQTQ